MADSTDFRTDVLVGDDLETYVSGVSTMRRREIVSDILSACRDDDRRVNVVFGLRRTGKTVAMRHAILDMTPEERKSTAFVVIREGDTFSNLRLDLIHLKKMGVINVFIDEVTFLEDFIEASSLFQNRFSEMGMKIFLSGTYSLSFVLASYSELFDKSRKISTTWIPFSEYVGLKGIEDIDTYLRYDGVLSDFFVKDNFIPNGYVYTAIAENIQKSLEHYRDGAKFGYLHDLYEKDQLTDAIVRFVEDRNHRFVKRVFNKAFKSGDLDVARRNLEKDRNESVQMAATRIAETLDIDAVTKDIMTTVKMRDKREIVLQNEHVREMERYFTLLDFVVPCPQDGYLGTNLPERNLLQQQGIRSFHLQAVLTVLERHPSFRKLDRDDRNILLERLEDTAHGFMTEEVILLDTLHSLPDSCRMFTFALPDGEFDMVVRDEAENRCHIFEIKHSEKIDDDQRRHLENPENLAILSDLYDGDCRFSRHVLYRGTPAIVEGCEGNADADIAYLNIRDYLMNLAQVRKGLGFSAMLDGMVESVRTESAPKP